ncbi:MAG: thioredoxin family protein [Sulfurihydrogenibium sp.]|uniref:thioredoxin family protein n=1 Tax=Sulfurihydrogenibium sp. TaxID=2053621 RepID=UPI000CB50A0B|nr:MAG: glutaredoxin [Sulfurihydrogenibium sp.]
MEEFVKNELESIKEPVKIRFSLTEKDNDLEGFLNNISKVNKLIVLENDTSLTEKPVFYIEKNGISVKFLGRITGGELKAFLESVKMVANNEYHISERILEFVEEVDKPVDVKVFVTTSCGWCPPAILKAVSFAIANPNIKVSIIECYSFPELATKYNVSAVPKTVINDKVEFVGVKDDNEFFGYIIKALGEV